MSNKKLYEHVTGNLTDTEDDKVVAKKPSTDDFDWDEYDAYGGAYGSAYAGRSRYRVFSFTCTNCKKHQEIRRISLPVSTACKHCNTQIYSANITEV